MNYCKFRFLFFLIIFTIIVPNHILGEDKKPVLAVLSLQGLDISENEAIQITQFLQEEIFFIGKYELVERTLVDKILEEYQYQQSVCDVECAVNLGNQLSANKVIIGTVGKLGNSFSIQIRLIDIETAKMENPASILAECRIDELPGFMPDLVNKLIATTKVAEPKKPTASSEIKKKSDVKPEKNIVTDAKKARKMPKKESLLNEVEKEKVTKKIAEPDKQQIQLAHIEKQIRGAKQRRTWGWIITVPSLAWTGLMIVALVEDPNEALLCAELGIPSALLSSLGIWMITSGNKKIKQLKMGKISSNLFFNFNPIRKIYTVGLSLSF